MKTFSRRDLTAILNAKFDLGLAKSKDIVEEILVQLGSQLVQLNRIELRGFGVFTPYRRKKGVGRNPRQPFAGDFILPERFTVRFAIGKHLKAAINQEP